VKRSNRVAFVAVVASALLFAGYAAAEQSTLSAAVVEDISTLIDADEDRLVAIFKDIHQNPELGFMEVRTARIVAKELESLGYQVTTGIGETGVVAVLQNGDGPVVMYRADMDANAAEETTDLPWASTKRVVNANGIEVPVAHLCGHDAHTTWMLGLARVMTEIKESWSGTLVLVAQPAEELIEGATAMVNDGLYSTHEIPEPDYLIGAHTLPVATGIVISNPGVMMAGTEQLDVTIYGKSAHGSSPQFSKDAGLMAAYAVVQFQAIPARVVDPRDPAVVTVGAINAGVENNTIPGIAELKLNFRFFDEDVREQMFNGVKAITEGVARTYGMPEDRMPTIVRNGYSSALVNDDELMVKFAEQLVDLGLVDSDSMVTEFRPATGSEDVHMLVHGLDGTKVGFLGIGTAPPAMVEAANRDGQALPFSNHQGTFQVDLDAIPYGAKVASVVVLGLLTN
jgi:hippurate hydrolase